MDILSVSQLTRAIKQQLEGRFPFVCVKGEITNFRAQSSGHLYFSLKDTGATISAVLFRGNATKLTRQPRPGDTVIVKGELSVYAPRGGYQIICRELNYEGVGDLLLQLHELKAKLQKEGLFDKKQPLPTFPKRIGVITSSSGAVIQDIVNVLKRRHKGLNLLLNPAKVQGEGAAADIAQAIDEMNQHNLADVLIVGRGGGSLEDLWPFNTEMVARAISRSRIPIISAVGHETDVSIADFCADVRAPTPSAAAEIAVKEMAAQLDFLEGASQRVTFALKQKVKQAQYRLDGAKKMPYVADPYRLLVPFAQKLDDARGKVTFEIERRKNEVRHRREKLATLVSHLASIDPKRLLKRGYCIAKGSSGIISASSAEVGEKIELTFHDGTAKALIDEIS